MAASLPSSAAASPPPLLRRNAAPPLSFRHSRRWRRPAAVRKDGRSAQLALPPAARPGSNGASGAISAAAAGKALPYKGREGQGSPWMVFLATAVAVCGSFEFGTCRYGHDRAHVMQVGYSAPAQDGIVSDIGLSNSEYGVFGSVLTIGAMIGALTCGRLADTLGRKMTMRFAAVVGIFGWLTVYFAKVPVFISEIAPKDIRGALAASNQLFICAGCSAAYIIGTLLSWRSLVVVGLIPCAVLFVGLFFIPESPRWLVRWTYELQILHSLILPYNNKIMLHSWIVSHYHTWLNITKMANKGRDKEFHSSLRKFRGEDSDISEEATEIKDYIESIRQLSKATIQDLFQRKNIYAVTVGIGLMIFQQLGGINALGFYTSYIFSSIGIRFSGKLGMTLIGLVQIPITLFGALLMDRSGRRALLLVSSSGTCLGCLLTGLSFYFKAQGLYSQFVPTLALCGILVYYAAYSVGMGPVPWVIMSEIFSIDMKAIAGGLVTLVNWISSFAVSYSFNFLMNWNPAGTFFMFSAASLTTVLFVARLVPETKGRTLEEIQTFLEAT
ncbi:hypothetical protein U9M48_007483 [Paspalum notatum var. saurae]|uniref:Major facilitator superfamily (MFS) profile domain-containing protein n=1 Tax=Paspalum notatum var. saurae TaxID=547442 RepID=A0AAQ3PWT6_PASNO